MQGLRSTVTGLGLLLALLGGLGVALEHAGEHPIDGAFDDHQRFDAGHDGPISENHVEGAETLVVDSCVACALRHTSPSLTLGASARCPIPPTFVQTSPDFGRHPRQHRLGRVFGRAPPVA